MLSMNETDAIASRTHKMAVYKGLKVAIYTVDKTEISLSRSDLIELVNVCILFIYFIHSLIYLFIFPL